MNTYKIVYISIVYRALRRRQTDQNYLHIYIFVLGDLKTGVSKKSRHRRFYPFPNFIYETLTHEKVKLINFSF